ncbi:MULTISPECIES: universal stress protein [unclassified Pseudomonas]|uniref:universal stress protein n=1 Tax=unclassified Pseudomonas TaxID=196821 RepID=UPI002B23DBF6|nr:MULTISPECIES: universal stress protein [unclassified Pseudomonas]MEA9979958.1 universal stress protein [Pseudomonas sp. RTS4]MEB0198216.1 universal stress protein [Pseudomonas sp. 5S4]MEB0247795.1 universal stress protein [Pseudomonas sp. 10S5]
MIQQVLIAYDGSEAAKKALNFANELTSRFNARLHIVAVCQPPEFGDEVETEAVVERSRAHYRHMLKSLKHHQQASEHPPVIQVVIGHPAEQIVRYAEANAIDHIVVGHRGHSIFERWLLGSVARQVIDHAPCAVTVIRG